MNPMLKNPEFRINPENFHQCVFNFFKEVSLYRFFEETHSLHMLHVHFDR